MTAIAELVAEAIAKAEETTPEHFAPKNECPDDAHAARYVTTIEGGSQLDGKESTLAEAVAWAEDPGGESSDSDGRWCQYPDHVVYVRRDLFTNALAHLATRAAEAEEKLGVMTLSRLEVMARTEEAMEQTDKALANTAKAIASLEAAVAAGNAWKAKAAEAEGRAERAEAALIRVVEVGDGVGFDVAVKALREAGLMDPEDDDEEDTAHE